MSKKRIDMAKVLKKYRKKHGLTQEGFAKKTGIARALLARWETGYSYPSTISLQLLKIKKVI